MQYANSTLVCSLFIYVNGTRNSMKLSSARPYHLLYFVYIKLSSCISPIHRRIALLTTDPYQNAIRFCLEFCNIFAYQNYHEIPRYESDNEICTPRTWLVCIHFYKCLKNWKASSIYQFSEIKKHSSHL